ncbi:MAG: rhamnosyltransferase [Actinomycetota bacterium]|jgi:rhamnosyltransferase|nr:rhamnosyltransferase [Actinomycetota bacterium]
MNSAIPTKITAIATAYHPDERLLAVVEAAGESCTEVLVVDNTPGGAELLRGVLPERVRVLRPDRNLGLAGALNLGLAQVGAEADCVLFLDQDSVLSEELVHRLAAHLADSTVGAAAPAPWDEERSSFIDPRTILRADVAYRDAVITSGMVVRRSLVDEVGGFREDFFVDCVDQDFCLRLRRTGMRIVQDKRVKLPHSLGEVREHRFLIGHVRASHHPTWRLYWVIRNGVVLVKENLRRTPVWCVASVLIMVRWVLLTALYERPRGRRLRAMWRGLRDGLRGRTDDNYLPSSGVVADAGA